MPKQKKNTSKAKAPTRLNLRQAPQETVEKADFGAVSNDALRLLLGQHQLRQTGTRREMVSRLENHLQQSSQPLQRQNGSAVIERSEIAELVASAVDQRLSQSSPTRNNLNNQAIQDGGESTSVPSPHAIEPSLPPPIKMAANNHNNNMAAKTTRAPFVTYRACLPTSTPPIHPT